MENTKKRVMELEGYSITTPRKGLFTILVSNFGNVVEFEDLSRAEMVILIHALECDETIENYVVADHHGAYVLD